MVLGFGFRIWVFGLWIVLVLSVDILLLLIHVDFRCFS